MKTLMGDETPAKDNLIQYIILSMTITMFLVYGNFIGKIVGKQNEAISSVIAWVVVIIIITLVYSYNNSNIELQTWINPIKPYIIVVILNGFILYGHISRRILETYPVGSNDEEKLTWNIIGLICLCISVGLLLSYVWWNESTFLPQDKSVGVAMLMCTVLHSLTILRY